MTPAEMARLHSAAFTMPRPWSEAEFAALLADPKTIALTEPAGLLLGRIVAGEAELLTLAVDPAARRQGIGARLLGRFLAETARAGAAEVFLEVAETNVAARALYQNAGFTLQGRRPAYYRDGAGRAVDALVLRRAL